MLHPLCLGWTKSVQIGQTERKQGVALLSVTRRRTMVRREAKFVQNTRHFIEEICQMTNFFLNLFFLDDNETAE